MKTISLATLVVAALCALSTSPVYAQAPVTEASASAPASGSGSATSEPEFLPGVTAPSGSGDEDLITISPVDEGSEEYGSGSDASDMPTTAPNATAPVSSPSSGASAVAVAFTTVTIVAAATVSM